jgi:hypothetical protein
MEACIARSTARGAAGIRLVQTAYNYRSLALYARLGFVVREPLSVVAGSPPAVVVPGVSCRPAAPDELAACDAVCLRVHGHTRTAEVREAIGAGTATVAVRSGSGAVTGYATGFGYGWHAVGLADDDVCALLASPEAYLGLGVLVPSRNATLLRWCLDNGLRIVQQSTLMTMGLYGEPAGAWVPSIAY